MSPKTHTAIRAVASILFPCLFAVLPWLTPEKAIVLLASITALVGGMLALSNLFHVPAKVREVMQDVLAVDENLREAIPAQTLEAAKKIAGAALLVLGLGLGAASLSGCISSAPVVPVTPANAPQVSACQTIASWHNGMVVGDFVFGGAGAVLGTTGALVTDVNVKTGLAIGAAAGGLVVAIGTAIAGFTASNFTNSKCSDVVGPLPLGKAAPK